MNETPLSGPALLFCPADRLDRIEKALDTADTVIVDLEDAVRTDHKAVARRELVSALSDMDTSRLVVRVNGVATPWFHDDLVALSSTSLETVMLPQAANIESLDALGRFAVIALCETAAGVLSAQSLAAHERCVGLAWGGQDLGTDLCSAPLDSDGLVSSGGRFARHLLRFAGAAERVPAIDTVRIDLSDDAGLHAEARAAAQLGFAGKLVIHPRQVPIVREAFQPSEDDVNAARAVMEAVGDEHPSSVGVVLAEDRMIDRPVVERARQVLRLAGNQD